MGIEEIVKTAEYRVKDKITLNTLNEIVNDAIVKGIIPRDATVSLTGVLDGVLTFRWIEHGKAKEWEVAFRKSKYGSTREPYKKYPSHYKWDAISGQE